MSRNHTELLMNIIPKELQGAKNEYSELDPRVAGSAPRYVHRVCVVARCVLLLTILCCHVQAQQSVYNYDTSGSLLSVTTSNTSSLAVVTQPQPQLLESNAPISFSVIANGSGLSFQWLSNGVPIPGATGDSLVLNNLFGTNFASYRVVISNGSGVITSAPAAIWPDSNGSGMPDWWQRQYFGNLNQLPTGDFDGDGVWNLDEYLERTDPTNAASYNPRLYVQPSAHGRVVASPAQPYYTLGQVVTLTAVPDPGQQFTGWSGSIGGSKPEAALVMNSHKSITANFDLPLPIALDNTNLVWTTGGDAPWFGQTEVSEDGLGAAQSGLIVAYQRSWLQAVTTLSQAMILGFWWSVSSQSPDLLQFMLDGGGHGYNASIAGEAVGWQYVQFYLPAGQHTLLWTYSKSSDDLPTGIPFSDSGWVDEVTLTPYPLAPVFQSVIRTNNVITLTWSYHVGSNYVVQYKTNLSQTNWTELFGTFPYGSASDTVGPDPQRFYRVVLLPY